jgi:hypothetical protein
MGHKVAPECRNVLACQTLSLCRIGFDPVPDEKVTAKDHEPGSKTWFNMYVEGMSIDPLQKSFVALIPISEGSSSIAPAASAMRLCRTSDSGLLLEIEESQIDSDPPAPDPANWFLFQEESTYLYFWTFSRKHFRTVIKAVRANIQKALGKYEFCSFQVVRAHPFVKARHPLRLLTEEEHSIRLNLLEHNMFAPASQVSYPGYYEGLRLHSSAYRWRSPVYGNGHYVFARCNTLDAFYTAELLHYHAISLRQRTLEEFAIFAQTKNIAEMADSHERVPEFEEGRPWYYKRFFEYAYDCAKAGVERDDFTVAVEILATNFSWQSMGIKIYEDYRIQHPCLNKEGVIDNFVEVQVPAVMNYFDFYRFGFQSRHRSLIQFADLTQSKIEKSLRQVQAHIKSYLKKNVRYADLMIHLDTHCVPDYFCRQALHRRYLNLSLNSAYHWWNDFEIESESDWDQIKEFVEWTGESGHKFADLFQEFFANYENIERYIEELEEGEKTLEHAIRSAQFAGRVQQMMNKLTKYNHWANGKTVSREIKGLTYKADMRTGVVRVMAKDKEVASLRFITQVSEKTEVRELPPRRLISRRIRSRWRTVEVKVKQVSHVVEEPIIESPVMKPYQNWPNWLNAFGSALALACSIAEVVEDFKGKARKTTEEKVVAVVKVAKDSFLFIDGFTNALNASLKYARKECGVVTRLAEIGEAVKGPGLILEAALNLHEGTVILLLNEDSLAAAAVREGDDVEGALQEARGLVLVASVVPGAVAAGSALVAGGSAAAIYAAALGPLGIGLAFGALVVIGISVAIYIHEGPANVMKPIGKALDKAANEEFGEFLDKERTYDWIVEFAGSSDAIMRLN